LPRDRKGEGFLSFRVWELWLHGLRPKWLQFKTNSGQSPHRTSSTSAVPVENTSPPYKHIDVAWKNVTTAGYKDLLEVCLPAKAYAELDLTPGSGFIID
jgi:hypothetical protein